MSLSQQHTQELLLDRLYAYMKPDFSSRLAPGKTAVVLAAQANPNHEQFAAYFQTLKFMLGVSFTHVEEVVLAAEVRERGIVAKDEALLERVRELGRQLGQRVS